MTDENKPVLKGGQVSDFMAHISSKAFFALAAVFLLAVVQLIRHGFVGDYVFLLVGSILSTGGIVGYGCLALVSKGRRSALLVLVALGGWIPYLFGCYLVFYRGFWSLKELASGFSLLVPFKAACFVLVGYAVVSGIDKVSEFVRRVDKGELIIE